MKYDVKPSGNNVWYQEQGGVKRTDSGFHYNHTNEDS
jgi:hypothetical protein